MRVVQALYWLHDVLPADQPVIVKRLRNLLAHDSRGPEIAADLRTGLSVMPIWMQSIVRELLAGLPAGAGDDGQADHQHDQPVDDDNARAPTD
jgi:CTP:molybdopterin cytidylyltransferase MocA